MQSERAGVVFAYIWSSVRQRLLVRMAISMSFSPHYLRMQFGPHLLLPHLRYEIVRYWEIAHFLDYLRNNILFNMHKSVCRQTYEFYGQSAYFDEDFNNLSYQEIDDRFCSGHEKELLQMWHKKIVSSYGCRREVTNFHGRLFKVFIPNCWGTRMEILFGTCYLMFVGLRPVFRVCCISPVVWYRGAVVRLERLDIDRQCLSFHRLKAKDIFRQMTICKPLKVYFSHTEREDLFATIGHIMRNRRELELKNAHSQQSSYKRMLDSVKIGSLTEEGGCFVFFLSILLWIVI